MGGGDEPVFFDHNGKRWLKTKIIVTFVLIVIVSGLFWLVPQIIAHKDVPALNHYGSSMPIADRPIPTAQALAANISNTETPVVGKGPLVRVLRVVEQNGHVYGVDPFTNNVTRNISREELSYIDGEPYVIDRYGYSSGKRIALTFDDGPNPIFTPKILDLLSSESAEASFFVVGGAVTRYPEIAQRIVREGHTIANHTFNHVDFDFVTTFQGQQEINQTQRVIAATTGQVPAFFRIPYGGGTDQSFRNSIVGLLTAQEMGYVVTSYDFDSNDWQFTANYPHTFPDFNGDDITVLVHDSGGDRLQTISYVKELIKRARDNGYAFVNVNELFNQSPSLVEIQAPTIADKAALTMAGAILIWPHNAIAGLFSVSILSIVMTTFLNIVLAGKYKKKTKYMHKRRAPGYAPLTTIVVPAYNEGKVIIQTVRSLLRSRYKNIEVIIVDDGSTDDTWEIAQSLDAHYPKARAIHQMNGGKSSAINNAIAHANGEIIISVDADTIFPPTTVTKLVRHFKDEKVGAVAGVVKVGNVNGMVTRWQALEYTLSIAIDRNAQAYLNSVMIIPGACGAWRKEAILAAGGLSHGTLAEDCDLTLSVQKLGRYIILQDNDAISYTEAPQKISSLIRQRFRWTFGSIQALWKHRVMLFDWRYEWLGTLFMPNAIISIAIPFFFWPILIFISVQNILNGDYMVIVLFFIVSLVLQFVIATIGVVMARGKLSYILAVPFARLIYGPIRTYILYKTILTAVRGTYVGWNKLVRTGTATYPVKTSLRRH
jgi:peptidoglycan-N-acetylglucosamine deacetylase